MGPGPAAFYRDACQLIDSPDLLVSTTHIVSHLLREIESALRDVLEVVVSLPDPEIRKARYQGKGHEAEIRAILRELGIAESEPVARGWLELAEREYGLHGKAHRQGLDRPRPVDIGFRTFWDQMEVILDEILDRLEARYARVMEVLDELLALDVPSRTDVKRLAQHVPHNAVARGYFFDRLTEVGWLRGLRDEGFFRQPPRPDIDPDDGTARLPRWPESQYLARIAMERPAEVLEIILEAELGPPSQVPTCPGDVFGFPWALSPFGTSAHKRRSSELGTARVAQAALMPLH